MNSFNRAMKLSTKQERQCLKDELIRLADRMSEIIAIEKCTDKVCFDESTLSEPAFAAGKQIGFNNAVDLLNKRLKEMRSMPRKIKI